MADLPASLTHELGHGGSTAGTSSGWPWDQSEWSPELQWPLSVIAFDKMRRQDAQVSGVMRAVTLPIRRARWHLDPNGARDEVVAHVAADFGLPIMGDDTPAPAGRVRGRFQWAEHLRVALLALSYGHMPFEQVYRIDGNPLQAHLAKLAPRMPATLAKIHVDRAGMLTSIEQYPTGLPGDVGTGIDIPVSRLVMYVNDREAGAWQGQSILRAAYKHWLLKDRLLRVDAMKHERNGMGIPIIEGPEGATPALMAELNTLAQSYRSGESSGGSVPNGSKLRLVGVEGQLPDTLGSIKYHDEQIARMMLAQFLQLGSTDTGARALGETFVDFFIQALQTVADDIAQTSSAYAVEDLVDLNWGEDEPAPRIGLETIGADQSITADAIAQLVTAGALTADANLEDWLRNTYRMADRDPNAPPAPPPAGPPVAAGRGDPPGKVQARTTPGAATSAPQTGYLDALTGHYAPAVAQALAGMIDAAQVAADWTDQIAAAAVDPLALGRAAVYVNGLTLDTDDLAALLGEMYGEAYIAGMHAGQITLDDLGVSVDDTIGADIDWAKWRPGNQAAAAELAGTDGGRGLGQLLVDADLQIRGITGTVLDNLANTLAQAAGEGLGRDATAKRIRGLVGDPVRAQRIAHTETARAVTVASRDEYRQAGVAAKTFLLSDGACPLCEENADAGDIAVDEEFPNGDPPVHPYCVCAIAPVATTEG